MKKLYRWDLRLLSKGPKRLNALCRAVRDTYTQDTLTAKTKLKIDLDPYGMY